MPFRGVPDHPAGRQRRPIGGTVVVCRGTYHEQVVVPKALSLQGRQATVNEAGVQPSLQVNIPWLGMQTIFAAVVIASSHVTFSGFTVKNAQGEGILAASLNGTLYGSRRHL